MRPSLVPGPLGHQRFITLQKLAIWPYYCTLFYAAHSIGMSSKDIYVSGSLSRLAKSVEEADMVSDAEALAIRKSVSLTQVS